MDEEQVEKDLKTIEEKETPNGKSTVEETTSETVEGGLINKEEVMEYEIEEMLADGTSKKKEIRVKHEKFTEINEKAKLFDQFTPLLTKIQKNPEVMDKLLGGGNTGEESLAERVTRIEEEQKTQKRAEIRKVLSDALAVWPDFKKHWSEVRSLVDALERQNMPYRDAVQRAYFAVNPAAISQKERLLVERQTIQEGNRKGTFSSSGGGGRFITAGRENTDEYELNEADKDFASRAGISPDLYKKHGNSEFIRNLEKQL